MIFKALFLSILTAALALPSVGALFLPADVQLWAPREDIALLTGRLSRNIQSVDASVLAQYGLDYRKAGQLTQGFHNHMFGNGVNPPTAITTTHFNSWYLDVYAAEQKRLAAQAKLAKAQRQRAEMDKARQEKARNRLGWGQSSGGN
ncbi:hypothetical protein EX895_003054 [Sporisorium graminicola]|uniref:Uncharacterized protein n=1 Tax=Sporisorium graminicola TaxID=280036 RepID=A0A4U7KWY0_9BASI|nr:hypothetical protein EX895_003054 [Sporisorium graminicola]TKY87958.1 hypothetical protein EX895_003054 [Sporisorium graminicola]